MVNTFSPFGIQDLGRREGGSPTMGLTKVNIGASDVTPIFNGDPVQVFHAAPLSGLFGKYITQASSGLVAPTNAYEGIFRGCEFLNTAVGRVIWSNFWPGSAAAGVSSQVDPIAYIDADPSKWYIAQGSTVVTFASSMIGWNILAGSSATGGVSSAAGNTTTGISGISLLSSTVSSATNSSFPFRLIDFYSNYAPPGGFVNGTDNSTSAQIMVVVPNNFATNVTAGST